MFVIVSVLLIYSFIGTLGARQPDIDLNRIKLIPRERFNPELQSNSYPSRRSINSNQYSRKNDYDYHSGRFTELRKPMHFLHNTAKIAQKKTPVKVHQPREDPRLFYQSDTYIKEVNRKNLNNDVSAIYPGRDIVKPGERRIKWKIQQHYLSNEIEDLSRVCIRCPHDRTLVAKAGADQVILQHPRLLSCNGNQAPRSARFVHMYGPRLGSLIDRGSHVLIGRVTYMGQTLQMCKMQIHVLIQTCPIPKYLTQHCSENDTLKMCNFTCRAPKSELYGAPALKCGDNMKWTGPLPVCKAGTWCDVPSPPEHGRISCKGATAGNGSGLAEGASCRVRCARGYRRSQQTAAICRRGKWTHGLSCQPKRTT